MQLMLTLTKTWSLELDHMGFVVQDVRVRSTY
jgi:hypothetical protein